MQRKQNNKSVVNTFLYLVLLCAYAFCPSSTVASDVDNVAKPRIAWFSTLHQDASEKSGFWGRVHALIQAAAEDLDIEFKTYYAEENYLQLKDQVDSILADPATRPDGIIFHNYKLTGEYILKAAERYEVKSVIFNAGIVDKGSDFKPRTSYQHWIGEILPDDQFAGAELLRQLKSGINASSKHQNSDDISVVAMAGNLSSGAYQARKSGLQSELTVDSQYDFKQFVPADWSRDTARKQFDILWRRYEGKTVFWSANDNMALGLIDAARAKGIEPGKDFIIGGIDWLPESLGLVKAGSMQTSIGGHFVEGMWALILLSDYLRGIDFAGQVGSQIRTRMLALSQQDLITMPDIDEIFGPANLDRFDFSSLSKVENRELERYPLALDTLISQLSLSAAP